MNHHLTPLPPAKRLSLVSTLLATTLLAACGGGGGGGYGSSPSPSPSPSPAAEYTVQSGDAVCGGSCGGDGGGGGVGAGGSGDGAGGGLGEMRNVRVTVTKPDGTVLGSAPLVNNLVSLYPGTYTGPIVLEFADDGSGGGQYYDEAIRNWVSLGTNKLHVLVPALTHHVSANVLTETAYQYLKRSNRYSETGVPTAAVMTEVNNAVRDAFNARVAASYQVGDITNYAVAVSDRTVPNSLPNTNAGRYGTLLAAIARVAGAFDGSLGAPAASFLGELANDMVDDDTINASVATRTAYGPDLPQTLTDALQSARADYGAPGQPAVPTAVASICFNPALFAVGGNWHINYLVTDSQQQTTNFSFTLLVNRLTSFQGVSNVLEVVNTSSDGTTPFTSNSYFDPSLSTGLVNYGSSTPIPGVGNSISVFTPPYTDSRFLMRPGDSQSIDTNETTTLYDAQGNVIGRPSTFGFQQTTTFTGYETITLPSGQVFRDACRYDTRSSDGSTDTSWLTASGQGVAVKSTTIDAEGTVTDISVLTSGSVNGQPVR